jgi:tetratricopeptide (TPR) repeat protein
MTELAVVGTPELADPEIEEVEEVGGGGGKETILDEAAELEEEGFYEEAIDAYMEALSSGLDPQRCHHGAARCYEELSEAEEAARECTECLKDNPDCCNCLTTRGWQYLALGMLMEAKADATAAIALAPSDVEVLDLNEEVQYELSDSAGGASFDEAQRLYTQGKFEDAIGHFSQAL